jgi:clan AA aspartic protease
MIQGHVDAFGREVVLPLELRGLNGQTVQVDAIIDTGFDGFVTVSPDYTQRLQLPLLEVRPYELGDGQTVDFDIHLVTVMWDGQEREVAAVVTEGGVLVGMALLYGYHLCIDVVEGGGVRLQPRV